MKRHRIKINDYLRFELRVSSKGTAMTAIFDNDFVIGKKPACPHASCNTIFLAEMTLAAQQMHSMEAVFDPEHNPN